MIKNEIKIVIGPGNQTISVWSTCEGNRPNAKRILRLDPGHQMVTRADPSDSFLFNPRLRFTYTIKLKKQNSISSFSFILLSLKPNFRPSLIRNQKTPFSLLFKIKQPTLQKQTKNTMNLNPRKSQTHSDYPESAFRCR